MLDPRPACWERALLGRARPRPVSDPAPAPRVSPGGRRLRLGLGVLATVLVAAGAAVAVGLVAPGNLSLAQMDRFLGVGALRDEGHCQVWRRNAGDPGDPEERAFRCSFASEFVEHREGTTLVHQVLRDLDRDRVVRVPGADPPRLEEWFPVVSSSVGPDAWAYAFPGGEEAGVFSVPPGARGAVEGAEVTSNGSRNGEPRILVERTYREAGVETVEGVEAVRWEASYHREEAVWHGQEQLRTLSSTTWVDPRNGIVLAKHRTQVVEMTPAMMARNQGYEAPPGVDEGEPVKVAEVTYRTTEDAREGHAAQVRDYERLKGLLADGPALGTVLGLAGLGVGAAAVGLGRRGAG